MITNTDCILLLSEIGDAKAMDFINQIAGTPKVSIEALKYINEHKPLDIINFYEHLRKTYNKQHSKVYINIVKEVDNPNDVLITLSSLLTQILLYSNKVDDDNRVLFLNHSRIKDITKVLHNYCNTYDITKAIELLRLVKADLLALEYVNGRRD